MKTREIINKNADTVKFAEHFKTKSSIKNLLKKVPNAKDVAVLFENTKYGKEILEYSNLNDQFDIILSDVFGIYTAKVLTWRATGDNRPLSARVELFRDLIINRMKKAPGTEIAGSLGDFMKSATGKEIEKILTGAGINEGEDLYLNIIIMIAARTFINNAMVEAEEVIVENAGHTTTTKKLEDPSSDDNKDELLVIDEEEPKLSKEVQKILEMVDGMGADVTDDEIRRFVSIVKPFVPDLLNVLYDVIGKYEMTNEIWRGSIVQRIIKDLEHSETLDDKMKSLLAFVASTRCDNNGEIILRSLFFVIIDLINHSTEDEHLYQDAKFIIRLVKSEQNSGAFLEEMVNQANRVNEIIKEFNGVKAEPNVKPEVKVESVVPVVEQKKAESVKEVAPVVTSQSSMSNGSRMNIGIGRFVASFMKFPA